MRSILVPLEESDMLASVLQTAAVAAQEWSSYLEGLYVRREFAGTIPLDSGVPVLIEDLRRDEWDRVQRAHALFNTVMGERNIPVDGRSGASGPMAHFRAETPPGEAFVARHARLFDLTVLGQPARGMAAPRITTIEAVLFESGRPLLLAPPLPPKRLGESVVIAWNGSTETARTLAVARPILERARRVVVLSVEGGMVDGPDGDDVVRSLDRTGIVAQARHVPQHHGTGETILEETRALGGDFIIKGAYTRSRLRQMIFGGATRVILEMAQVPVFMAH
ncbi:universal stress protein [Azospirillum canadense]|uniref:universal stress protein n=1 Tax=Azospirillum canadense TaxID=403962 RepID=UPI002226DA1C|nr:universal stress protein [Azospirillum canadense]MCW2242479.1 nucleotide-binding universal stress UspA family protein [Azospirillum canadense]